MVELGREAPVVNSSSPRARARRACAGAGAIGLALASLCLAAADTPAPRASKPVDFEEVVAPLFKERCTKCHGAEQAKGGLRLDRRADALAGGGTGRVIEPGKASESLLIEYVSGADPTMIMPPKGERLSPAQVDLLRAWIDQGANWPESTTSAAASPVGKAGEASRHWAFVPVRRPLTPEVRGRDWVRGPIDGYVLARLEKEGVAPSPEADRATLLRRITLDLTGLPPTPEEVQAFESDPQPDAYERIVDRLLGSPHFGERWGRHWLDLARYADSDGYEKDNPRPNAWRYRDWVIAAVNRDMPFDRFTVEQLAGDLLPEADLGTRTATGFHRNTLTNTEGGVDKEEYRVKAVVDRVNTTGTVWLGLSVACAQCHSHKYDPITQKDYYGLFAFFNTSREVDLPVGPPPPAESATTDAAKKAKPKPGPAIPVLAELEKPPRTHVLIRGDFLRPGDEVQASIPVFFASADAREKALSRLDLARWLVSRENPLGARVVSNRIWGLLFGRPLVGTPEDFGARGEPPTHPELLDWLSEELMANGWSQKHLIRAIVTSASYRQASTTRPELVARDPMNLWVARQNRLRLEAEIIRDLALSTAGLLTRAVGGPSVRPPQPSGIAELTYAGSAQWVESTGADRYRRGLYTWFQRTSPYPMLQTFDAPDANVCAVRRDRSNTPLQALTLLNDANFQECARVLGQRVEREAGGSRDRGIERLVGVCLGRQPSPAERQGLANAFEAYLGICSSDPAAAVELTGLKGLGRAETAEAAAWVALARTVLNLDEFVTRE